MKKNILYLTRNGLLEPLGQSQILSYVRILSKDYSFTILTFEKRANLRNKGLVNEVKSICIEHNIKWKALNYITFHRQLSILLGSFVLFFKSFQLVLKQKPEIIHARSYYPAFIALLINKTLKVPFIFDMRALWPEELVVSGRLKKDGIAWKKIKKLEKSCLANCGAIVSLTNAAVVHLDSTYPKLKILDKTFVIPTCADLDRFNYKNYINEAKKNELTISCIGSILSGWFKIDYLAKVINYLVSNFDDVRIEILTRDNPLEVISHLQLEKKFLPRVNIKEVRFSEMPKMISSHSGSIFFFNADISKLGSAPTRMAELLGCGIPILTNPGVGDVKDIILENNIGVLLNSTDQTEISRAIENFLMLIKQNNTKLNCRSTAKKLFSLTGGANQYKKIYQLSVFSS